MSYISFKAIEFRASLGHLSNQFTAQKFIIVGYYLHLLLNLFPIGENAKTICKFSRTLFVNKLKILSLFSTNPRSLQTYFRSAKISSLSSPVIIFDTSPEFKILLISSR